MATVEKTIDVNVPVSTAYGQWTQFEEFPKFMEGVVSVKQIDDNHLRWVAEIHGEQQEWDAEIVTQDPDHVIAWRSTSGIRNDGRVEFAPIDAGTRVRVEMEYDPEGMKESVGAALGFDERQVEGDLERFKDLIEDRGAATGEWRGKVEAGQVVEDDTSLQGSR